MAYCNCDNPKKDHRYGPGPVRCVNCKDVWKPVPEDTVESLRVRINELEDEVRLRIELCGYSNWTEWSNDLCEICKRQLALIGQDKALRNKEEEEEEEEEMMIKIRKEVMEFAERIQEETHELIDALRANDINPVSDWPLNEAADVANFAMMIFDNLKALRNKEEE